MRHLQEKNDNDEALSKDLIELGEMIRSIPEGTIGKRNMETTLRRVEKTVRRRKKILSLVQEALAQTRLDMKYLVFDVEATRRERDAYKQQLEGNEND